MFAGEFLHQRPKKSGVRAPIDVRDVLPRGSLAFPNDAGACRICAIAQVRNYSSRDASAGDASAGSDLRNVLIWLDKFSITSGPRRLAVLF